METLIVTLFISCQVFPDRVISCHSVVTVALSPSVAVSLLCVGVRNRSHVVMFDKLVFLESCHWSEKEKTLDLMLPAITMETEASHMLEAALVQMDDIIAVPPTKEDGCKEKTGGERNRGKCNSASRASVVTSSHSTLHIVTSCTAEDDRSEFTWLTGSVRSSSSCRRWTQAPLTSSVRPALSDRK
ncbi:hypothetical protein F2P81_006803 [Scophthalmus maximus]|uniref:Uncharacterized protein n=1 Tax=Scophthalmus maximus TaxID=52904 RepID=A0A6A4T6Y2_SCOMX|nr:hypothetical protein F2P81_006803 [Scophthalmus maximus]